MHYFRPYEMSIVSMDGLITIGRKCAFKRYMSGGGIGNRQVHE
jgi:hypothetical protein